ncbi:Nif3-like dinuclear metal center hexameric protein [Oscillospiraceae bacterium NTUH-002-81]|nr:Nif3-like dinuclear metal center hexameric protein [Oscillospiraceae bacterium NTUH-002-81]
MMECKEVMRRLEGLIPPACASDWDNVGLLVGDPKKKVDKILVALDASDQVLDQAEAVGADMLLTHHPLIFSPVKNVREDDFIGWRIRRMIRMDLSYYAMHTNYDVCRMGEQAAARMGLDLSTVTFLAQEKPFIYEGKPAGFGAVGDLETPMSLGDYAAFLKQRFGLPGVIVYGDASQMVYRAATCPGSGKSFGREALAAGADVYVTGDVDYHFGTDMAAQGMAVIDAGHYGIEHIFIADMRQQAEWLLEGEVQVEAMPVQHPYMVI